MLIDVVLEAGGSYWRKRLDLPAPPAPGAALPLLDAARLMGTVVGATEPDGDPEAAQRSVLVRAGSGEVARALEAELHSSGWRPLL